MQSRNDDSTSIRAATAFGVPVLCKPDMPDIYYSAFSFYNDLTKQKTNHILGFNIRLANKLMHRLAQYIKTQKKENNHFELHPL